MYLLFAPATSEPGPRQAAPRRPISCANHQQHSRPKTPTPTPTSPLVINCSLFIFLCFQLAALTVAPTSAFQYDIWFKYPHPYTQTDQINYCAEQPAAAAASGASGVASNQKQQHQAGAHSASACQTSLPIYVNTLDSPKTLIPYTISQLLDFCPLQEALEYDHSQHTEWDDNIRLAPFDIKFLRNEDCKLLCKKSYKLNSSADLYRLEELKLGLARDYYHHWFADTFPFSWCYKQSSGASSASSSSSLLLSSSGMINQGGHLGLAHAGLNSNTRGKECFIGFPIGYSTDERGLPEDERVPIANFTKPSTMFLFNHFDFTIFYEPVPSASNSRQPAAAAASQMGRITALRINPRSINHELASTTSTSSTNGQQQQAAARCAPSVAPLEIPGQQAYGSNSSLAITYSYSVRFVEDEPGASWAQRWQRLEATLPGTAKGRWIFAYASLTLVATGLLAAYAVARTVFADRKLVFVNKQHYQDQEPADYQHSQLAWKQLAGDIFREPLYIGPFSVLIGSGCQFIASIILSEFFSTLISPFSTSLLVIVVVLFVVVHGFVGGYAAIRLYRTFGGEQWRLICALVTLLNPLVLFCMLVMSRNLLLLYNGSLLALNVGLFGSMFMTALCFVISLPSALAGGSVAFKMAALEFPVRPTANQRQLPEQLIWRQPLYTTLAVGLIPLLCFWATESYPFYDSGGYIITLMTILTIVCLSIGHCYFHLTQFDYRWWWRSYLTCGIAAIYYFLHCVYYISTQLFVDTLANALLYLSFAFFICVALFLLTGTIGFLVTFAYLWQSYARTNASPDMNYAMFQKGNQLE